MVVHLLAQPWRAQRLECSRWVVGSKSLVAKLQVILEVRRLAAHATDVSSAVFEHVDLVVTHLEGSWQTPCLRVR